jgi:hypothetical protein
MRPSILISSFFIGSEAFRQQGTEDIQQGIDVGLGVGPLDRVAQEQTPLPQDARDLDVVFLLEPLLEGGQVSHRRERHALAIWW